MDFSARIRGNKAVSMALGNLPRAMRNKTLRPALRAGGQVVKEKAVENINRVTSDEATGLLAKSVVVKNLKMKRGNLRVGVVLAAKVSKKGVRVGLYGSVLEFGKENQEPRPFLRPAIKEEHAAAVAAIMSEARSRLNSAVEAAKRG